MGTDVDAFLRRLAQALRPRANQSADVLLRVLRAELPEMWKDDELSMVALEETALHVTAFLDMLEHGLDVSEVETPASAPEVARRIARRGVPVSTLLRAYRLGHVSLLQMIQREASARLTGDWELINAAEDPASLIATGFVDVDRGAEQVVAAYKEQRDRLLRRRLLVTNEGSRRISTTLDTARTARGPAQVSTDDFADLVTVDLWNPTSRTTALLRRRYGGSLSTADGTGVRTPPWPRGGRTPIRPGPSRLTRCHGAGAAAPPHGLRNC
ncbi:hypothetical protein SGLAM104S_09766 [Streptomyces glaucescens]